jgi:hypothetical protein
LASTPPFFDVGYWLAHCGCSMSPADVTDGPFMAGTSEKAVTT